MLGGAQPPVLAAADAPVLPQPQSAQRMHERVLHRSQFAPPAEPDPGEHGVLGILRRRLVQSHGVVDGRRDGDLVRQIPRLRGLRLRGEFET